MLILMVYILVVSQKEDTQLLEKDKAKNSQVLQYILFAKNEITPHANIWINPILGIIPFNKSVNIPFFFNEFIAVFKLV